MSKLIEITTNLGTTYLTDAQVNLEYNSNTYVAGQVGRVGRIQQKAELESGKMTVEFSGVDKTIISLFNNEIYRDYDCTIYECDVASDWTVSNVATYYTGQMVKVSYLLGTTKSVINLTCKALYGSINRANAPDLGLLFDEYMTDDATIYFGKRANPIQTPTGGGDVDENDQPPITPVIELVPPGP